MDSELQLNYAVAENGASISSFTSQYHHDCNVTNLMIREPSRCWFTSIYEFLPQNVVINMGQNILLSKVGIFLHGENNQNPKRIAFYASIDDESVPETKENLLIEHEIEWKGGDHLWTLETPVVGRYVKYVILENFGGSGAYTTKLQLYGKLYKQ